MNPAQKALWYIQSHLADELTLDEISDVSEATLVAERIQASLADPLAIAGHELDVRASIGIAVGSADVQPTVLIHHADVAMYRAKAEGHGGHEVFGAR